MSPGKPTQDLAERLAAQRHDAIRVILNSPLITRFGFRISLWNGFFSGPLFAEMERRFNVTRDEHNVLFFLTVYGSTSAKVISESLGRPKNSVSRAVDSLLRRGLIHSESDPTDRRRIVLAVEPEGQDLYLQVARMWRKRQDLLTAHLTAEEKQQLEGLLDKLLSLDGWDTPLDDTE